MVMCKNCKFINGIEGDFWCDADEENHIDVDPEIERECENYVWEDWEGIEAQATDIFLDHKLTQDPMDRLVAQETEVDFRKIIKNPKILELLLSDPPCDDMVVMEDDQLICNHPEAIPNADEEDYIEEVGIRCTKYLEKGCLIYRSE